MPPRQTWLPAEPGFNARLAALKNTAARADIRQVVQALARTQLDFTQMGQLDRFVQGLAERHPTRAFSPVRVALLTSCTVQHLLPSLRIAAAYISKIASSPGAAFRGVFRVLPSSRARPRFKSI